MLGQGIFESGYPNLWFLEHLFPWPITVWSSDERTSLQQTVCTKEMQKPKLPRNAQGRKYVRCKETFDNTKSDRGVYGGAMLIHWPLDKFCQ